MLFSIIIPVYNVALYLRACLDSVVAQTCAEWECICVDDGSTDGGGTILDEYAAKDKRFRVIHQENAGVSAARNRGFEASHGEWILFMDSDDVLLPNALEKVAVTIAHNECEMVTFEMCRVKNVREEIPKSTGERETLIDMNNAEETVPFIRKNFPHRLWAWNKCIKRSLIGDLRFENYQPCEDAVFTLTCMTRARQIVVLPDVLYKYLQHDGSCLSHVSPKLVNGNLNGMCRLAEVMMSWRYFDGVRKHVQNTIRNGFLIRVTKDLQVLIKSGNVDGDKIENLRQFYATSVRRVFCGMPIWGCLWQRAYRIILGNCNFERVNIYVLLCAKLKAVLHVPFRMLFRY